MEEVIRGAVVPVGVVPIGEVEVTVAVRTITTVAAVTTDGTAPAIDTVEAVAVATGIPGRPGTIPDGTPGKMIARVVAAVTRGTIPTKIHEIDVPRIGRDPVRIIRLRRRRVIEQIV